MSTGLSERVFNSHYGYLIELGCLPIHIHVMLNQLPNSQALQPYAQANGVLVLTITDSAIRDLTVTNHRVTFKARFSGVFLYMDIPMPAILAMVGWVEGLPITLSIPIRPNGPGNEGLDTKPNTQSSPPKLSVVK